jgi:hypothetical protein
MSTGTQTFETIRQLKAALPSLPDSAVIRDRDGDTVPQHQVHNMSGTYEPYTVTFETPAPSLLDQDGDDHGREAAPLDAAKVKAGDTVTLAKGETSVRGPVTNIEHATHTEIVVGFAIKNLGWRYIEADVVAQQDGGAWTLTAHTPAPEPKPEWEPGTVAAATVDGKPNVRVIRINDWTEADHWRTVSPVGAKLRHFDDGSVTDVRPLVVIDPAAVDVDALAEKAYAALEPGAGLTEIYPVVEAALAHLGIEATS